MSAQSTRAVGDAPFEPEDYTFTASLLRRYTTVNPAANRKNFYAVCSNNLNIILAALDAVPELLAALKGLVPQDFGMHPQDFAPEWHAAIAAIARADPAAPEGNAS